MAENQQDCDASEHIKGRVSRGHLKTPACEGGTLRMYWKHLKIKDKADSEDAHCGRG